MSPEQFEEHFKVILGNKTDSHRAVDFLNENEGQAIALAGRRDSRRNLLCWAVVFPALTLFMQAFFMWAAFSSEQMAALTLSRFMSTILMSMLLSACITVVLFSDGDRRFDTLTGNGLKDYWVLMSQHPALMSPPAERKQLYQADLMLARSKAKTFWNTEWDYQRKQAQTDTGLPPLGCAVNKCELEVSVFAMPESDGTSNWTATVHHKGAPAWGGMVVERSEKVGRVHYEADCWAHFLGLRPDEPEFSEYDLEKTQKVNS